MEQQNNLWFLKRVLLEMSVRKPRIQKYVKRKKKASLWRKLLFLFIYLFIFDLV